MGIEEDMEDMLFGPDALYDNHEHASEVSDEDMLDVAEDDEPNLWDLEDNPLPKPALTGREGEHHHVQSAQSLISRNEQLPLDAMRPARDRLWVIARIEGMLERIVDGLLEESKPLTITLKSRAGISRRRAKTSDSRGKIPEAKQRDIHFPGSTAQEAWNFTVLLRILELVHSGLMDDTVMTKRDMYYRHPELFVKQSVVDRYVDDLACTLEISRSQLNVTAAAKGLVAGSFRIMRHDGCCTDVQKDKEGILVPKIGANDTLDTSLVKWVLVIEKEATFRSLLSSAHWDQLGGRGVVLTAKGYPDLASRRFLRHIADQAPHLPMLALMDLDPDGIAILSTYKYGSYRLAHEDMATKHSPGLNLPNMRWLGVRRNHISRLGAGEGGVDASTAPELQGLMKLTARDRTKAMRMLEWDLCAVDGPEQEWRHELQTMLVLNTKAEMQILDELRCGLVSWLSTELGEVCGQDSTCSDDGMLF